MRITHEHVHNRWITISITKRQPKKQTRFGRDTSNTNLKLFLCQQQLSRIAVDGVLDVIAELRFSTAELLKLHSL